MNHITIQTFSLLSTSKARNNSQYCLTKHIIELTIKLPNNNDNVYQASSKSIKIVKTKERIRQIISIPETLTLFLSVLNKIYHYQFDETHQNYFLARVMQQMSNIDQISLSRSHKFILQSSIDYSINIIDASNGSQIICKTQTSSFHKEPIIHLCWNSNDTMFASGDCSGLVIIWANPNYASDSYLFYQFMAPICFFLNEQDRFFGQITCLQFNPLNDFSLLASYSNGTLLFWELPKQLVFLNDKHVIHNNKIIYCSDITNNFNKFYFDIKNDLIYPQHFKLLVLDLADFSILKIIHDKYENFEDEVRFKNGLIRSTDFSQIDGYFFRCFHNYFENDKWLIIQDANTGQFISIFQDIWGDSSSNFYNREFNNFMLIK